ncbi:olfactory receptor 52E8-like [Brienomyrus brachyistius]|uniref:olfactory receptor 52E8-like n=1 Tax=Brienomyrus brachyistius TaxID=42636 RepID=UPI0020B2CCDB|nr:olfactory receptor 52E8-like [Brienomyrus brachyistius]
MTSSMNSSLNFIVRPMSFIISGFSSIPNIKYYYVFLSFIYTATVLGNLFVMVIIYVDQNLHTPKYLAIFNLAMADLGESTALIPKVIETFLFNTQEISYGACLANLFFVFLFNCMQSITLTLLAYDRFVAICVPLRYNSIVTNTSMAIILTVLWLFDLTIMMVIVALITRLSFCKSTVIDSYFCDHGPMYKLACNDNSLNAVMAIFNIVTFIFLPLTLIGLSYACILVSLFKIASWEGRLKALKTCFSHLILVLIFYIPLVSTYIAAMATSIHRDVRIINTSLSYAIPPMLNPIVYSLNTAEIKDFVRKMFRRKTHSVIGTASQK